MTDPLIELDTTRLQANPGGQASVRVTVRNLDHRVQGYRLDVLPAEVSAWAEVPPPILNLDVNQEGTGVIVFSPPGGGNLAGGPVAFAIKATSVVDPSGSAVAEGQIEIGQVFGLTSKITPVTSSGRWRANHRISFTNWGNAPVHLRLSAHDPDERLGFLIAPESLDLPVGGTADARVKVRTRNPVLRGTPVRLPFKVVGDPFQLAAPAGAPAGVNPNQQVLDGAFTQKPVISRGVAMATVLALVLVIAGVVFALTRGGDEATGADGSPPERPTGLRVLKATPTSIFMTWDGDSGANLTGYKLYLFDESCTTPPSGPDSSKAAEASATSVPYDKLSPNTTYCFELSAVNDGGESARSEQVVAKTPAPADNTLGAPGAPEGRVEGNGVRLNWDAVDGADHYEVSRYASLESTELLDSDESAGVELLVPDLPIGSTQCFAVTALLADGTPGKSPSDRTCVDITSESVSTTGGGGEPGGDTPADDAYSVIVAKVEQAPADVSALVQRRDLMRANGLDDATIWSSDSLTAAPPGFEGTYILVAGSGDAPAAIAVCEQFNASATLSPTDADNLICGSAASPQAGVVMQLGAFQDGAEEVE